MNDERRLGLVRMDRTLFTNLFKTGKPDEWVRCVEGLPDDAELVGLSDQVNFITDEITLKFWSMSFPVCQPGGTPRYYYPLYSALHVTAADLKFLAENPEWKREAELTSKVMLEGGQPQPGQFRLTEEDGYQVCERWDGRRWAFVGQHTRDAVNPDGSFRVPAPVHRALNAHLVACGLQPLGVAPDAPHIVGGTT